MAQYSGIWLNINIQGYDALSGIWRDIRDMARYTGIWWDICGHGAIFWDIGHIWGCDAIPGDMTQYLGISQDMREYV